MTTIHKPHTSKQPIIGVLLVHGFNGSRNDMAGLEAFLQERGIVAENMVLPGHGGHVRELLPLGWQDWSDAVLEELRALKRQCDVVFLVGHSLGGALALHAAAHEEIAGIVTMCAPIYMQPWMKPIIGFIKYVAPLLPTLREDVRDPQGRRLYRGDIYRWTPMRPIASLLQFLPHLRAELPKIKAPALIMISVHDHVVPARDGRAIYQMIGSSEKHLVTFYHSYHVIMKDHDREEVFEKTAEFIAQHASKAQPHRKIMPSDQTA
jgi:carboxylesterase